MKKFFKNFLLLSCFILSLIGYFFYSHEVLADIAVAGCDHVGARCDIHPWGPQKSTVFAPLHQVWSAAESSVHTNHTRRMIGDTENRLNGRIDEVVNGINAAVITRVTEINNRIDGAIARVTEVNNSIDGVRNEIRNSLRNELQNLLRAQTCENHVVPNEGIGTPARIQALADKFNCIRASLDNWRGVNPQGQVVGIVDNAALSRAQIVQLLRSLELLFNDPDLTVAQRQYMGQIQNHFIHFNME